MPSVLFNREYSPSHAFSVHDYHPHRSDYSSLSLTGLDDGQLASPQSFDAGDMLFSMDQDDSFAMAPSPTSPWGESYSTFSSPSSAALQSPFAPSLEFDPSSPSVYSPPAFEGTSDPFLASISSSKDMNSSGDALLASWIRDPNEPASAASSSASSSSAPIPIPTNASANDMQMPFVAYGSGSAHNIPFPTSFSPSDFDLSVSPPSQHAMYAAAAAAIAPQDTTVATPSWASNLWSSSGGMPQMHHRQYSHGAAQPYSFANRRAARQASMSRSSNANAAFMSTSAPAAGIVAPPSTMQQQQHPTMHARQYSSGGILGISSSTRHDDSSMGEDRDATVRRKKAAAFHELRENSVSSGSADEQLQLDPSAVPGISSSSPPAKSHLKPPKLAPSAWQLYFTDWIQHQQSVSTRKLNVAQAAKEAGQDYANLSAKEKEPYKRRSQALKEARERELASYMKSLTPQDIKLENAYRTAQRKAGKSRKGNIKDPNAPKKPLSAYFMFLQVIRADPDLVREVFGDETETTKQSVLAARKWRSMTDEERKPFLAKAEAEKILYEDARKMYEEGHGPSSGLGGLSGSFSTSSATGSSTGMMNFGVFSDGSATSGAALRLSSRRMSMTSESESDSGMLSSPGGDEGMHTFHFRS